MHLWDALLGLITAVTGFLLTGMIVTEVAQFVGFSASVGVAGGVVGGLVLWMVTYVWLGDTAPAVRRRGLVLATFGCVFLAVVVGAAVGANLHNSQAFSVAGIVGVLSAIGVFVWFRQGEQTASTRET